MECSEEDYRKFLAETMPYTNFVETPYFRNYVDAFENLAETKNKRRQKSFQNMNVEEQSAWLNQRFYTLVKEREREKLRYFAMVYQQTVLVITAPVENKKQKSFLGYDWTNRRGNEGIVILNEGGMLYNPQNRSARDTFAALIRSTFEHTQAITEYPKEYYKYFPLKDMIDFTRIDFNKSIRTTGVNRMKLSSKYPLRQLTDFVDVIRGVTYDKTDQVLDETPNVILTADNITLDGHFEVSKKIYLRENKIIPDEKRLKDKDCFICFSSGSLQHIGKVAYISGDTKYYAGGFMGILRPKAKDEVPQYIYFVLNTPFMRDYVRNDAAGANIKNLSNQIGKIKIPVPPVEIQKKIVDECVEIEGEYQTTRMAIDDYRARIEVLFQKFDVIGGETIKLDATDKFQMTIGKRVLSSELLPTGIPVYSANVQEPFGYIRASFFKDYNVGTILWGIDGDWDVRYIPPQMPFYPTDHCGTLRVQATDVNARYLAFALHAEGERRRFTRTNRPSLDRVRALRLELPPKQQQDVFVNEVERMESQIAKLEEKRKMLEGKKQGILKKYLL